MSKCILLALLCALSACTVNVEVGDTPEPSFLDRVEHRYAENDGVRLHYVSLGKGPLIVMIHGFPDFWYSWRDQMQALSNTHQVVAIDNRGYNRSDQPEGVAAYTMPNLVGDIAAVIRTEGARSATIVGHDWGGAIAWSVAAFRPELVDRLIVLNLPHPNGLSRELRKSPAQRKASEYAFAFQDPDAHNALKAEQLAEWVADPIARERYVEAFERSSFDGMLNYYRANYARPAQLDAAEEPRPMPPIKAPVLLMHGLEDWALLPGGLNGTWEWVEQDLTMVTVPGAGHFVQHDASAFVTRTMRSWLADRPDRR
ncbi:MAG: alpha/beta hydrolase [Pseudomonadota bacterium]